jgi:dephospho-CoA kinase
MRDIDPGLGHAGKMLVVGLCGGIGAGKTTVAGLLAERGAVIVDVDGIGRHVLDRDEVRDAVAAEFGAQVLAADGTVDRTELARMVFTDHERLRALEAISHPAINREVAVRLNNISSISPNAVAVLDIAVLVESDLGQLPDGGGYSIVVVVEAATDLRIERLAARGVSVDETRDRMALQASDEERRAAADHVVVNDSDLTALTAQVDKLWAALTG